MVEGSLGDNERRNSEKGDIEREREDIERGDGKRKQEKRIH